MLRASTTLRVQVATLSTHGTDKRGAFLGRGGWGRPGRDLLSTRGRRTGTGVVDGAGGADKVDAVDGVDAVDAVDEVRRAQVKLQAGAETSSPPTRRVA